MTPQQMHIEAAKKVIHELLDDPSAISIRGILTPMIALALAEAENRAAWRVWDECEKTLREFVADHNEMVYGCRDLADGSMSIVPAEYMLEYGPRPTTENQA